MSNFHERLRIAAITGTDITLSGNEAKAILDVVDCAIEHDESKRAGVDFQIVVHRFKRLKEGQS